MIDLLYQLGIFFLGCLTGIGVYEEVMQKRRMK